MCGSRCEKCRTQKPNNSHLPPCEETGGYRERSFRGSDTVAKICDHIMTSHYKNTVVIAHNAKGFDNYPVLNTLIDHHGVRPDKILYNGSKVMYMHVAKNMNLTFLDSLNFIGMLLLKIPESFGFEELRKRFFPLLFNTEENQSYVGMYLEKSYYAYVYIDPEILDKFLKRYVKKQRQDVRFPKRNVRILRIRRGHHEQRLPEILGNDDGRHFQGGFRRSGTFRLRYHCDRMSRNIQIAFFCKNTKRR